MLVVHITAYLRIDASETRYLYTTQKHKAHYRVDMIVHTQKTLLD